MQGLGWLAIVGWPVDLSEEGGGVRGWKTGGNKGGGMKRRKESRKEGQRKSGL